MKNRSRLDIVARILDIAIDGTAKTKIMYLAYLSFAQLKEYLSTLMENGLIEFDARQKTYKTTKKGREFLVKYRKIEI
jgi:predicted transcriptional regulator